jgi:hypothetical protein
MRTVSGPAATTCPGFAVNSCTRPFCLLSTAKRTTRSFIGVGSVIVDGLS